MTRPKVPPDQRQRTAQACESCKRRKQKCNGLHPCNTCEKRHFTCIYADREPNSPSTEGVPAKRRAIDGPIERKKHGISDSVGPHGARPASLHTRASSSTQSAQSPTHVTSVEPNVSFRSPVSETVTAHVSNTVHSPPINDGNTNVRRTHSIATTKNTVDDVTEFPSQSRMLQDPSGRVLYIGDSATLSFLELVRMVVESVAGPSPFTTDPRRHKIVEGLNSLPGSYKSSHVLPDEPTARVLVETFFINTHGLLQVFQRDRFLEILSQCYLDPLSASPSWLCLLYLVFAIGLTMATPLSGSNEALVIDKLRTGHVDRAEAFYLTAKEMNDPMAGLEDQDFWSIQVLLLMSFYMLAKSKRNTAFALLGMAARSALALGLHREEAMVIFSTEEQNERKDVWRSIFVMDRLLSCSLGRPTAISEDDCSGDTLHPPDRENEQAWTYSTKTVYDYNETGPPAMQAAVRSCRQIGIILKEVYQKRKISTRLAQEISDVCQTWPRALTPILQWRQAPNASPSQGVAILHINLFYCHSVILLTRPFLVYILNKETQVNGGLFRTRPPRPLDRIEKFGETCVIASIHTTLLVQNAFEVGHLSRRNPVVIYFLFAATLVILASDFAGLYKIDMTNKCVVNAISIMNYCAECDQQAVRLVYILSSFRDVVVQERLRRRQSLANELALPSMALQLYGVQMTQQQQQHASSKPGGLPQAIDPLDAAPRLHQVPIHIYPGMQTAPLDESTIGYQVPEPLQHQEIQYHHMDLECMNPLSDQEFMHLNQELPLDMSPFMSP